MKKLILSLMVILMVFVVRVEAQESYAMLSCFYECKSASIPGTLTNLTAPYWQELTTLMLVNNGDENIYITLVFLDGNQNPIFQGYTNLSPKDLDEIHVCDLFWSGLGGSLRPVPQAGIIEAYIGPFGLYDHPEDVSGWVKNLIGSFRKGSPVREPFALGNIVTGVAKTNCELKYVPTNYTTYYGKIKSVDGAIEQTYLIEGTKDPIEPLPPGD